MKIGFGQAEYTPKGKKVNLVGQFDVRITDEVISPLMVEAMVLQSENARTIWVSVDALQVTEEASVAAYEQVKTVLPDLKEEELVLSATHIHTGPAFRSYSELTGGSTEQEGTFQSYECVQLVAKAIARAVDQALERLSESRVELAVSRIQTGTCRRVVYKDGRAVMYGNPYEPDFLKMEGRDGGPMQLLYVYNAENQLAGIVVNVPCTAQCDEHATYMTADYWGVTRSYIRNALGEQVVLLPLCRSAGDQSPHHVADRTFVEHRAKRYHGPVGAMELGTRIAKAIVDSRDQILTTYSGAVYHAQAMKCVQLPKWSVTEEEYQWALEYLGKKTAEGESLLDVRRLSTGRPLFDNANAYARIKYYESGETTCATRIYATVLGDVVLLSNPFELYIEYADRIRMALPDQVVFDVQLSYDGLGYLATENAVKGGGYSAYPFNGPCSPAGGEALVAESVELVRSLVQK